MAVTASSRLAAFAALATIDVVQRGLGHTEPFETHHGAGEDPRLDVIGPGFRHVGGGERGRRHCLRQYDDQRLIVNVSHVTTYLFVRLRPGDVR